jgi:hypothetical protein
VNGQQFHTVRKRPVAKCQATPRTWEETWKDQIKENAFEIILKKQDGWIHLAQDRDKWGAEQNEPSGSIKGGEFLD